MPIRCSRPNVSRLLRVSALSSVDIEANPFCLSITDQPFLLGERTGERCPRQTLYHYKSRPLQTKVLDKSELFVFQQAGKFCDLTALLLTSGRISSVAECARTGSRTYAILFGNLFG
jgi:hypothetical protein